MLTMRELQIHYVANESGKKTSAILPIEEFLKLLEGLDDISVVAECHDQPTISHEEVITQLKRNGKQ